MPDLGTIKVNAFWITAVIVAVLAMVFFAVRRPAPAPEPETVKADAVPRGVIEATPEQLKQIRVEPVREQTMDVKLEATGKVGFNEDRATPVLSPYPGRVLEVLANPGDLVKQGQPLLTIESPDVVTALNDLRGAHSDLDKATIARDAAEKAAARARRLHDQEALSTKDLQAAESELARDQEDYRRAQAALDVVRNRLRLLGKTSDEIARFESSPADQTDRRILIQAPIGGTIVDRKVGLGQYIKPDNPDPLFLIADLSSVWINAEIYEHDLPRVRAGASVHIQLAAYPGRDFVARIAGINPTVDPATRTVKVRCVMANPEGLLKPEMFARIRIADAAQERFLTVPSAAILTEGEHSFVLVEDAPGRFHRREVKSGPEAGGVTAVEEGLHPGDRVVTSGVLLLSSSEGSRQ
jgi:cobalt-zinc-cadmium efflux system membrane fusion protein